MQANDQFKKRYPRGSEDGFRDTFYAVSASLALHVGIALALITATAMSAGLKLWEDPVIHVSLIPMSAVMNSHMLTDAQKTESLRREDGYKVNEPAVEMVSIDKHEKNKIEVGATISDVVETHMINVPAPATVGLAGSQSKGKTDSTGGQMYVASNASSSPASMAVPRYRDNTHPAYPRIARLRGYEGVVLLSAEVHADGQVGELMLKKSSGFAVLDQSALEAVKTWKFEPGKRVGTPIAMWVDVPVKFILKDDNSAM